MTAIEPQYQPRAPSEVTPRHLALLNKELDKELHNRFNKAKEILMSQNNAPVKEAELVTDETCNNPMHKKVAEVVKKGVALVKENPKTAAGMGLGALVMFFLGKFFGSKSAKTEASEAETKK